MIWFLRLLAAIALAMAPMAACGAAAPPVRPMGMAHHGGSEAPCHRPDPGHSCPMAACCAIAPDPQAPLATRVSLPIAPPHAVAAAPLATLIPAIDLPPPRSA